MSRLSRREETKTMKKVMIRLPMMIDEVKNFCAIVSEYPYDIDLSSGRYIVDAKSLLGIFSVDLSRPIEMHIYSDDCDELLERLSSYAVPQEEA